MKQIRCCDVGYFPNCEATAHGETEEEVIDAAFTHGMEAHKWPLKVRIWFAGKSFVDEVAARTRAAIRDV